MGCGMRNYFLGFADTRGIEKVIGKMMYEKNKAPFIVAGLFKVY